jgi:hypothetical protein
LGVGFFVNLQSAIFNLQFAGYLFCFPQIPQIKADKKNNAKNLRKSA